MNLPKRKSNRLPEYDYSQPRFYFITVCTYKMTHYFGSVSDQKFTPSTNGDIVTNNWLKIPQYFPTVGHDVFQIMPNHIHGILAIDSDFVSGQILKRQDMIIPKVIREFKRFSTLEIRKNVTPAFRWQRSYYDHVIRNERSLERIREYILLNPENWERDRNRIDDNPFNM